MHWHYGCGFGTTFAYQVSPEIQYYRVCVKPEMSILPIIQIHYPAEDTVTPTCLTCIMSPMPSHFHFLLIGPSPSSGTSPLLLYPSGSSTSPGSQSFFLYFWGSSSLHCSNNQRDRHSYFSDIIS